MLTMLYDYHGKRLFSCSFQILKTWGLIMTPIRISAILNALAAAQALSPHIWNVMHAHTSWMRWVMARKTARMHVRSPCSRYLVNCFIRKYSIFFDFSLIYFNLNSTTTGDASRSRTATIERFCTTPRRLIRNARTRISRDNAWPIAHRNMKKCKRWTTNGHVR